MTSTPKANHLLSILLYAFTIALTQPAYSQAEMPTFNQAFDKHPATMLLIDPDSKRIVNANAAAANFYGHSETKLESMTVADLNMLTPEQVAAEVKLARQEGRQFFIFRHLMADGSNRKVEVRTVPLEVDGQVLLYSIITPVTAKMDKVVSHYQDQLEAMVDVQTDQIASKSRQVIWAMGGSIALLLVLIFLLYKSMRRGQEARRKAEENEATLSSIFDGISDAIICAAPDGKIINANRGSEALFGYTLDELISSDADRLYKQAADASSYQDLQYSEDSHNAAIYETDYRRANGSSFRGETLATVIADPQGKPLGYIRVIRDITERKKSHEKLRLAASVFKHTSEGIMIISPQGTLLDTNDAYTLITGYSHNEAIGQNIRDLFWEFHDTGDAQAMYQSLQEHGHWEGELETTHANSSSRTLKLTINAIRDSQKSLRQYVALFYDITDQKLKDEQLRSIAHYDSLTNLPNRLLLADRLEHGMLQIKRRDLSLAIVYLDLDGFKAVNDTWGHEVGDLLLVEIARRMKFALRETDTVARLGGDEFAAIFVDLPKGLPYEVYLLRLLKATNEPVYINNLELKVSASLGVTFYPQQEEITAEQLLRQADQAMYQAKLAGKGRYHIFDSDLARNIKHQHEEIERLKQAVSNNEFVLHYQPKVNMRTAQVFGVEALIRWQHPKKGLLYPADFLPLTEEHALAVDIGEWVIEAALRQLALWHSQGNMLSVSINVGPRQLQQDNFTERLEELLNRYPQIDPGYIELEVLESSIIRDLNKVSQTMRQCIQLGVNFALDDFGTGYSSLRYLKELPASTVKIDRGFVFDMLSDKEDLTVLKGIIQLGKLFNKQLVAEGVESVRHGEVLLSLDCDLAQGYAIARPMPAEEMSSWIAQWQAPAEWLPAPENKPENSMLK
ncbi:bifunctional diguanylate cyclase/phosphodiesterase [Aliamphritea spongicola]|uniref:bifunctional diguanylate cyclase/phosphodiesterase n=1 Tax=Aliamphritea spongicola TaxID=707589 RepID=UPI00196B42A8|nr:bifunctional diguanylate cyclase/phosphodiesterase [Aliamphritea spongicola]MBN3562435.1 EAL domain-containing protein [Aliamphritea spongicola]